jgi:hypothetical protein
MWGSRDIIRLVDKRQGGLIRIRGWRHEILGGGGSWRTGVNGMAPVKSGGGRVMVDGRVRASVG